jgi:hypothetical protein
VFAVASDAWNRLQQSRVLGGRAEKVYRCSPAVPERLTGCELIPLLRHVGRDHDLIAFR